MGDAVLFRLKPCDAQESGDKESFFNCLKLFCDFVNHVDRDTVSGLFIKL